MLVLVLRFCSLLSAFSALHSFSFCAELLATLHSIDLPGKKKDKLATLCKQNARKAASVIDNLKKGCAYTHHTHIHHTYSRIHMKVMNVFCGYA